MKARILVFILLNLICWFHSNSQQYASLQLSTIGVDDYILVNEESLLYEGKVTKDDVLMEEQNMGQNVRLDFTIENPVDGLDDYFVRLSNPQNTMFYGYKIEGGEISIEDHLGSILLTSNPGDGYFFKIIRCDSTIFYVHEDKVIFCREFQGNGNQLNGVVHVDIANYTDIDVAIEAPEDCIYLCEKIQEQYLVLEEFIEWRQHVLTDSLLKFKYVEKYSIAETYNDFIHCQWLDNHNNVLYTENLPNQYGINLHNWSIPEQYLEHGEFYVFRVSGMNKGKTYNIRCRYDGD